MIISCPSCGAGFFVSLAQIGSTGRRVKCSKCKNIWHATVPGDAIVQEDVIAERIDNKVVTGSNLPAIIPIKIQPYLFAAPAIFAILIAITTWIYYPEVTNRYGLCGPMCVEDGMRVEDIIYDFERLSNKVVIEYSIANRSNKQVAIPAVQINLVDTNNTVIRSSHVKSRDIILEPGSSVKAKSEFKSVSPHTKYAQISLGNTIKFWFR